MSFEGPTGFVLMLSVKLENVGSRIPDVAKEAAGPIGAFTRASHAKGQSPGGQVWARRKKDGALAYQRPTKAITFRGEGYDIVGEGEDVLKYPQTSARYPREIFPTKTPPEYERAIDNAVKSVLDNHLPKDSG